MRSIIVCCLLVLFNLSLVQAGTSQLWGTAGELWNSKSRLPDYSHAGYQAGEASIPNRPVVRNVKDYGATGNGSTNDLAAFNSAISAASNGAVLVPKGRYRLDGRLRIGKSNVVLRGEGTGADGTVLYFTRHLTDLLGGTNRSPWRYGQGGLLWVGTERSRARGSQRTSVTANSVRGDYTITVASTSGMSAGSYYILRMSSTSLLYHLYNNQCSSSCFQTSPGNTVEWPFKVKSVSGNRITLSQPLRFDVRTSWGASIYNYAPVREVGVENLRIETVDRRYKGHHQEDGYNGLAFIGALNCWAKDIVIKNTENGMDFAHHSKNCEARNIIFMGPTTPITAGVDAWDWGHHGCSFQLHAADNMLTDYQILDHFIHDITVCHVTNGNVVRRGMAGVTMCLDHHRYTPFENLFCDLHMGDGFGPYTSSGNAEVGPNTGARETFWNLRSNGWQYPPPTASAWLPFQMNVIPCSKHDPSPTLGWLETVENIEPWDLWVSQLKKRTGQDRSPTMVGEVMMHPKPGSYKGGVDVYMQCITPDAEIRYTTNGTTPTQSSPLCTGPVWILKSSTVKARAFKTGLTTGSVTSYTYTITPTIVLEVEQMDQLANYIVDPAMNNQGVTIQPGLPATAAGYGYHNFIWGGGLYDVEVHAVPENDGSPRVQLYIGGNSNLLLDTVVTKDPAATNPVTDRRVFTIRNAYIETKMTIKLKGYPEGGAGARMDKLIFKLLSTPPTAISQRAIDSRQLTVDKKVATFPNPVVQDLYFDLNNVFINTGIQAPTKLTITIFSQRGKAVFSATREYCDSPLYWDGRGWSGQPVGPGIYFYTVSGEGIELSGRIMKIK